jgi:hypothetical protein
MSKATQNLRVVKLKIHQGVIIGMEKKNRCANLLYSAITKTVILNTKPQTKSLQLLIQTHKISASKTLIVFTELVRNFTLLRT